MVGLNGMAKANSMLDHDAITESMDSFKRSDAAREELLARLVNDYQNLRLEHEHLESDFENERASRRNHQEESRRNASQLKSLKSLEDQNGFVLALIDGDGVIFQDALLRAGREGGSEAASKLQTAIRDHIALRYDNSAHWPIMVHIYLSLDKLSEKLFQVGLLKYQQDLRPFSQSFNMNQPLFSIIDVGQGKERADYKIKEELRMFGSNPTCKHIVFGGCHDAGYLINLDQYKHNQAQADHITLLESTPSQRGFADLPFQRTRFDAVFKSEPLPEHSQLMNGPTSPPMLTKTLTNRSISPTVNAPASTPGPSVPAPSTDNAGDGTPSWATVGKAGSSSGNINLASKNASKKEYIYYNKDGYRLDEPLPPKEKAAFEAIDLRMRKHGKNLCNNYHLSGKCAEGDRCKFQHGPKLSAAEKTALNYKTRQLACKHRKCETFDCYLGHQCAFERDLSYCQYPETCNLRMSHGMDSEKYARWDREGNMEYVH